MSTIVLCDRVVIFSDEVIKWMKITATQGRYLLPGPIRTAYRGQVFQGEALANHPDVTLILELPQVLDLDQFFPHAKAMMERDKPFGTRTEDGGDWAWLIAKNLVPILPRVDRNPAAIIDAIAWAAEYNVFDHVLGLQFPMFLEVEGNTDALLVFRYDGPDEADEFDLVDPGKRSHQLMVERIRRVHLGEIPPFVIKIGTISGPLTLRFAPRGR